MTFNEAIRHYRTNLFVGLLLLAGLYYTIVPDMVRQWYDDDNYSHGFLVPFIAGYFLYQRWEELKTAEVSPWSPGLAVVIAGLFQLTVARLGTELFTMRTSLIVILAGLVLYWFGKKVMAIMAMAIGYLVFMVPLPYIVYDSIAFPLKLLVTKYSVLALRLCNIPVLREGNIIIFPSITLEVADACSGMRSLMSLLALSTAYAIYLKVPLWKKLIVIFAAIPIAILTNGLRVFVTGVLAQHWGAKAAEGFFHEFAGLAVFVLAMGLLILVGLPLKRSAK